MKIKRYTAMLLAGFAFQVQAGISHCTAMEYAFDNEISCLYMGPKDQETKKVLITPKRKISRAVALDRLSTVVGTFEAGGLAPEEISIATDPEIKGETLRVRGPAARLPNTKTPVIDFNKGVEVCRIVDWESKCKPLQ